MYEQNLEHYQERKQVLNREVTLAEFVNKFKFNENSEDSDSDTNEADPDISTKYLDSDTNEPDPCASQEYTEFRFILPAYAMDSYFEYIIKHCPKNVANLITIKAEMND